MSNKNLGKVFALIASFAIISLLIISGPADAFVLGLSADQNEVDAGDYVTFNISLKIDSADGIADVERLILNFGGPTDRQCIFDVNGNIISGCESVVAINRIDTTTHNYGYNYGYGYGYGYSNGELKYEVIVDTANFYSGTYNPTLQIFIGDKIYTQAGNKLIINPATTLNDESVGSEGEHESRETEAEENTIALTPGSEFDFTYEDYAHELTVDNLNEDSVDLTIYSDPQNVNVKIPEPASVDINGDSQPDATFNLWYVGKDSATINVNSEKPIIFKERKTENQETITLEKSQIKNYIHENSVAKNSFALGSLFGNSLINTILLITNAIILLLVIIAFIIRRR